MAAPNLSANLNKTTYAPGEEIVLTVAYSDPDTKFNQVTITGTDQDGNAATVTVTINVNDAVKVEVTDPARAWTKTSDNGSVAVFKTTA
jgi:hypothetical protein